MNEVCRLEQDRLRLELAAQRALVEQLIEERELFRAQLSQAMRVIEQLRAHLQESGLLEH